MLLVFLLLYVAFGGLTYLNLGILALNGDIDDKDAKYIFIASMLWPAFWLIVFYIVIKIALE